MRSRPLMVLASFGNALLRISTHCGLALGRMQANRSYLSRKSLVSGSCFGRVLVGFWSAIWIDSPAIMPAVNGIPWLE